MASTELCSSWLSSELVEQILYRLPIESLLQFKLVCKKWYDLFMNNTKFIDKHFDLSQERFIRLCNSYVEILNPVTKALLHQPISKDFVGAYSICSMIHCDGLFLCKCHNGNLAVWNPYYSRVKWIKPSSSCNYSKHHICGFGYSGESYKILRLYVACDGEKTEIEIEIYHLKSNRWTSVDAKIDWCFHPHQRQDVSMKGNMYWNAYGYSNLKTETFIQSFDFSTETFKPICPVPMESDCFDARPDQTVVLSGFGGDRLSLLHQRNNVEIQVWVTNKVTDEVVSWSKCFNVTRPDLPIIHSCFHHSFPAYFVDKTSNNIMLWFEELDVVEKYVKLYEMGDGEIKKQVETGRYRRGNALPNSCYAYVPRLALVPE